MSNSATSYTKKRQTTSETTRKKMNIERERERKRKQSQENKKEMLLSSRSERNKMRHGLGKAFVFSMFMFNQFP